MRATSQTDVIQYTEKTMTHIFTHPRYSGTENGKSKTSVFYAAAFLATVVLLLGGAVTAFAAVSVTQATGGEAISADTNIANGTATWTTLTGPTVSEGSFRDFPTSGTFILNAPSGFSFNTGATVTATISRYAGTGTCFRFTSTTATPTASTVTFTLNGRDGGSNTTRCQVVFSNMQVRPTVGTPLASGNIVKTGTASVSGITNGVTSFGTLTEVAGALDHFSFAAIGTQVAGTPFNITMTAKDAYDNTVTSFVGSVDLSTTAGTIAPTQSSAFSSGVRTESVTVSQAGTGKTVSALDHGGTGKSGTSSAFTVNNPVPTTTGISPSTKGSGEPEFTLTVDGTNFNASSVVYWNGSARATTYISPTRVGAIILASDIAAAGTFPVTVGNPTPGGGTSNAQTFTVNQSATKFVILPPASGTVDAPVVVTIQAQKPDDSVDTNYQHDVTLHTTGSAIGGGLVDIVNGVGTMAISDTAAETVTLSLSDTELTNLDVSSTQPLTFASGATTQFVLSSSVPLVAGQREAYTITRKDQYGNARTTGSDTVYLYSSSTGSNKKFYDAATGGAVITSITIPDGQSSAEVWYYDELAGTWTITASDNASAPDGNAGINDAVEALQVDAGPVARFTLDHPSEMTADTRLGFTLAREDQFANVVTAGATTAYFYSNSTGTSTPLFYGVASGGSPITSIVIPDGQSAVNAWYVDPNPGVWTITASDNASAPDSAGIIDAVSGITVVPAPIVATRFVIQMPVNGTVDASIPITVQAEDASGNVDSTYQTDVTLNANGSATGGGLVDIVDGVGTIALSDTVAQTVQLSLTDSQGTGLDTSSTRSVTFAPGAVAQFSLDNPGDVTAGTRIGYTVTRKDQYGNLVTAGVTDVYLYSTSDGLYKKFYDSESGGSSIVSLTISDGHSSAAFWQYDEKAGDWFITVSDNATAPDSSGIVDASDALTVLPAPVATFLLNNPGDMTAGTRLGYTLTRKDQYGNLVTSGVTLAYLYTSSTGVAGFYDSATGGIPITIATLNDGQSSSDFWYYDESPGDWTITASDSSAGPNGAIGIHDASDPVTVSPIPIVATRFVILPVSPVQVNTPAVVTVQAQDDSGNIDTTYEQDVTLETSGSATGGGLVDIVGGVGHKTVTDSVAETVALSLSDTEHTGLNVSSTQSLLFSVTPVPSAGAGGATGLPAPVVKGVRISGRAFPGALVTILGISRQGATIAGKATAATNGSFSTLLTGVEVGASSYSVVAADTFGRTTQTKILSANYANALLTLDASLFSPTLGLVHPVVRKGDVVGFIGSATPGYTVRAQVDGTAVAATGTAATDGSYKILFPTTSLEFGSHAVRVWQVSPAGMKSETTPQKVFIVTALFTPQTDFNQDGVINVQDWSVFLSRWGSRVPSIRLRDDLNGDGKVDVTDLSIFVRTLKK